MGKQIIPTLLAFVLGFGLGYMYHSQSTTSSSPSKESFATKPNTIMETLDTKFQKVDLTDARGHARKYKKKHPHDEDPEFHTTYAVWTELDHINDHFEKKIKLEDLKEIMPTWGPTGIRVYFALNDQEELVNYLVFTDSSYKVDDMGEIYNDQLDNVYLIKKLKIDLNKEKVRRKGPRKGVTLNSHVVCNPRCPETSLF